MLLSRLAVLGQLMPCANDCLSSVISFTMPGPPKPPLIHITDLKDREVVSFKKKKKFSLRNVLSHLDLIAIRSSDEPLCKSLID